MTSRTGVGSIPRDYKRRRRGAINATPVGRAGAYFQVAVLLRELFPSVKLRRSSATRSSGVSSPPRRPAHEPASDEFEGEPRKGAIAMGRPWDSLTSAERLDAVLLAVGELADELKDPTGSEIAYRVWLAHPIRRPRSGGDPSLEMSDETRITPAMTALRRHGLIGTTSRTDGLSGSGDWPTERGRARIAELKRARAQREQRVRRKG